MKVRKTVEFVLEERDCEALFNLLGALPDSDLEELGIGKEGVEIINDIYYMLEEVYG